MAGWKDFRDIVAWQRARELKLRVDEFLKRPTVQSKFKYRVQRSKVPGLNGELNRGTVELWNLGTGVIGSFHRGFRRRDAWRDLE